MQKYKFTGHLSPLPPGVKLPLQISGDVYLASDVESLRASYQAALGGIEYREARIAELQEALKRYGIHTIECSASGSDESDCDCGLSKLMVGSS